MSVTIIGAGNMARAIGMRMALAGESVTIMDRTPENAQALAQKLESAVKSGAKVTTASLGSPITDDMVVLALFYPVEKAVVGEIQSQLAGKTIIEITNPLNATFDDLATPPGTSAAEEIAALLPNSTVVKAFNTTFAGTLVEGSVAGHPLDVFLASDDANAKGRLALILKASGLRPLDAGPLKRARQLEGLGLLHISQQFPLNTGFASAVKIIS